MQIEFIPMRCDHRPRVARFGDTLVLDGVRFDFGDLPEGAMLPADAVASKWIAGPVERRQGRICLTLVLSHGADAPEETRFPVPMILAEDGDIQLPAYSLNEETEDV